MLEVNLTGTFLCTQAALPDMLAAGSGRVVNIASTAAQKGYAYVSAYVAAKHGVLGLTRSLALELARKNITVNAVCPGYTETDILRESIANVVAKTGRSEAQARAEFAAGLEQNVDRWRALYQEAEGLFIGDVPNAEREDLLPAREALADDWLQRAGWLRRRGQFEFEAGYRLEPDAAAAMSGAEYVDEALRRIRSLLPLYHGSIRA